MRGHHVKPIAAVQAQANLDKVLDSAQKEPIIIMRGGKVSEFGTQRIYVHAIADWYLSLFSPARVVAVASAWQTLDIETTKAAYFALGNPIPRPKGLRGLFHSRYHWYAGHVSHERLGIRVRLLSRRAGVLRQDVSGIARGSLRGGRLKSSAPSDRVW